LSKIFETFFSLKDTKSEDSKNCGLGLAVVKDIVENHLNAKIELESTLGQGSVFRVCF
jgi:signal transduction histidine kinase